MSSKEQGNEFCNFSFRMWIYIFTGNDLYRLFVYVCVLEGITGTKSSSLIINNYKPFNY